MNAIERGSGVRASNQRHMAPVKVLVVDDDQTIVDLLSAYLTRKGFQVDVARDGVAGLAKARQFQPDVVVLDIMLPGLDGLEVLRRLRSESSAYIVMLTAKAEETDKIVGLSVGADDYVTKPFSPRELTARIHAILRRERGPGQARALTFRTLRIDPARREAWKDDARVDLTTREFDLLYALASYPGHVLSREQLIARVWGADYFGDDRVVDAQVKDLRRKLGDDPGRCPADIFSNVTPVKTSSRQCRRLCGERNANPESQSRICPSVGSVIRSNPRREHQCHPG